MPHKKVVFDEEEAIKLFKSRSLPFNKIAEKYKISTSSLQRCLERNNVERDRTKARRGCTLNEHVFDKITPESAYWLGFLMTDGCVKEPNRISIGLQEKDVGHLEKLRIFFGSNHKLSLYPKTGVVYYGFRSKYLKDKLSLYNIIPRKSLITYPTDELSFNRDFWRGAVDGDGSVILFKKNRIGISLVGGEIFVNKFNNFIKYTFGRKLSFSKVHENTFQVGTGGNLSLKIMKFLYDNSNIYLDRKKERVEEIKKLVDNKVILHGNVGEYNGKAILNKQKVKEIRDLFGKESKVSISKKYGISVSQLYSIYHRRTWKDI